MDPAHRFGQMVFAFQYIENDFVRQLALLLRGAPSEAPAIIASNLSFSKLVDTCDALIRNSSLPQEIKDISEVLIRKVQPLEEERNKYVHSYYDVLSVSAEGFTYERIKRCVRRTKGYVPDYEHIKDSSAFDDLTGRLHSFLLELNDLNEQIFFEVCDDEEMDWHTAH